MQKPVINAILRSEDDYVRQDVTQRTRFFSAKQKQQHFQIETEYQKALIASKTQRMFAKPFIASLGEFADAVEHLSTSNVNSDVIFAGSADGTVKILNYRTNTQLASIQVHQGGVTGLQNNSSLLLTTGMDQFLNYYNISNNSSIKLSHQLKLDSSATSLSMSALQQFALTTPMQLLIYDIQRYDPILSYQTNQQKIQFNQTEQTQLGAISDIQFTLFDTRTNSSSIQFKTMSHINDLKFNPFQPHQLILATNDTYAYSFDMRNTSRALDRYGGFPYPITSIDISPEGRKLILGSNQGTLQLYNISTVSRDGDVIQQTVNKRINKNIEDARNQPSRFTVRHSDMYHNRRMGQINSLKYSQDGYYIFTASSDGNVRVWKSNSSNQEKTLSQREKQAVSTNRQLINKFQNVNEVHQVLNSRIVPKKIRNQSQRFQAHEQAELKKSEKREKRATYLQDQVRKEEE